MKQLSTMSPMLRLLFGGVVQVQLVANGFAKTNSKHNSGRPCQPGLEILEVKQYVYKAFQKM